MQANFETEFGKSFHSDPILSIDPPLTERQQMILKAIVETYIMEAEPVASKSLLQEYEWAISSATVRKEMSDLEDKGYLEQPHTSAGRVPTDKGYRAYVDELLTPHRLLPAEEARLGRYLDRQLQEVESLIKLAADALSAATGLTALVVMPRYEKAELRQIHLLLIEPGRALCVLILTEGMVKDQTISIGSELDQLDLTALSAALGQRLAGYRLHEINQDKLLDAVQVVALSPELSQQIVQAIYKVVRQAERLDVYVKGQHLLLRQPEFKDPDRANSAISELQRDQVLAAYLCADDNQTARDGLMIRIGRELAIEGLQDMSFIASCYRQSPAVSGQIAVIGPRRMAYDLIISNIEYVRRALSSVDPGEQIKEEHGA